MKRSGVWAAAFLAGAATGLRHCLEEPARRHFQASGNHQVIGEDRHFVSAPGVFGVFENEHLVIGNLTRNELRVSRALYHPEPSARIPANLDGLDDAFRSEAYKLTSKPGGSLNEASSASGSSLSSSASAESDRVRLMAAKRGALCIGLGNGRILRIWKLELRKFGNSSGHLTSAAGNPGLTPSKRRLSQS